MKYLIPNIGSTSFKYQVLEMPEETVLAEGRVERIGQPDGECADYPAAIRKCIAAIAGPGKALKNLAEIDAVGFKAVHAGGLNEAQIIDEAFLRAMKEFSFLAPAHNPAYIAAIQAFRQELPGVPLVALVETGPYRQMDEAATTYAVPYEWRSEFGMRRYGFHGASHRSAVSGRVRCWGRTACATSPATWEAVRAWRRFATAWPWTPVLAPRRSRAWRRTTGWATSMCLPCCT